METELGNMATRIIATYEQGRGDRLRTAALEAAAVRYNISPPVIMLTVTDAGLRAMPLADRCKAIGITEEEFISVALTPEFKKFIEDYEAMGHALLRLSAQEKLSRAIPLSRYDSDEVEDFSIERDLVKPVPVTQQNVQVNNYNTLFDQARGELLRVGDGGVDD